MSVEKSSTAIDIVWFRTRIRLLRLDPDPAVKTESGSETLPPRQKINPKKPKDRLICIYKLGPKNAQTIIFCIVLVVNEFVNRVTKWSRYFGCQFQFTTRCSLLLLRILKHRLMVCITVNSVNSTQNTTSSFSQLPVLFVVLLKRHICFIVRQPENGLTNQ